MNTSDAVLITGELYAACSKLFPGGIKDAYLYGSYARNDYNAESDVDILLTVDAEEREISCRRGAIAEVASMLSLKHDVTVSITAKPLVQFKKYSAVMPFYKNVLREGIRFAV